MINVATGEVTANVSGIYSRANLVGRTVRYKRKRRPHVVGASLHLLPRSLSSVGHRTGMRVCRRKS